MVTNASRCNLCNSSIIWLCDAKLVHNNNSRNNSAIEEVFLWHEIVDISNKFSNFAFDIKRLKFDMEKINRIKAVLAEEGKTGKWLAEHVGRDPVTVSKWCTNSSQPDLPTLRRIADVLNIDIARLLNRTFQSSQPQDQF